MSVELTTQLWMGGIILFGVSFYAVAYVLASSQQQKK